MTSASTRTEIRLAGSGGQGLILGMHILFRALGLQGRRAAQSQSYEPTSRGGFCYSDLIVSDDSSGYPLVTGLDMIAGLSQMTSISTLGNTAVTLQFDLDRGIDSATQDVQIGTQKK